MSATIELTAEEFHALAELLARTPASRSEMMFLNALMGRWGNALTEVAKNQTANQPTQPVTEV